MLKGSRVDFLKLFEACRLCPRECGINRKEVSGQSRLGFCKLDYRLRVAYVGAHFGEEPPITGSRGSGTIFFSGCSLKCSICQNYQISMENTGKFMDMTELSMKVIRMIETQKVHNINFVTPDHFFPYTFLLAAHLRKQGHGLPILYNLSGYQSISMLNRAEEYADIYLPDYKYADSNLSMSISGCRDYPRVALESIAEMVRQKGFLDSFESGADVAAKGVLVRHLILPGKIENSLNVLNTLFLEFGAELPLSVMSQYHPVLPHEDRDLNRLLTKEEFDKVYSHAMDLGFRHLFVQFPDNRPVSSQNHSPFLPDFRLKEPFSFSHH